MASRRAHEGWLRQLTDLYTAPGREHHVVRWVRAWVARRGDLTVRADSGGNLLIRQKGRKSRLPVIAVAHMDHPAFVVMGGESDVVDFEFRGGVDAPYFEKARIEFENGGRATVVGYDPAIKSGVARLTAGAAPVPGEIGRWVFSGRQSDSGRLTASACDDLAGVAAALAALDLSRGDPGRRGFGVLLTRAEEVGLVGAIHAARTGTVGGEARILSIETSRELANARIGEGPIIRVGDAVSAFDGKLANAIAWAARSAGLKHQRALMDGGGCEASAFGLLGYRATGLCVALGNWHNRGNLALVEKGEGRATPMPEEISIDDFHGLVDLIHISITAVDAEEPGASRLEAWYEEARHYLD